MINNFDQSVDNARMIEWSYSADFTFLKSALETGADVNCLDPQTSDSPLMIACRNGYIDIIHLCLAFGAKNDPHPDFGQTALHAAVSEGQLVAAATVLETADVSGAASIICNLSDSNGQTPLHVASTLGAVDIVELLLRYGADISSIDIHGQTSLHICGGSGNKACLAMLLDHGGDDILESLDHNGNSVLHHASFNGHIECVRLLLETAANVTARNKKGQTAYHLARSKGHDQIILLLTEYNGHVPLVTSSPRYFQHQLQPSNITSTSLKVSPGNFVDQSIPFTPERIFQYSQHQRHFSDSDALSPHQTIQGAQNINHSYMNMALPRPHTLSSPVVSISSARVRYSQSTPTLSQSSWSVVAPRVIDNSSSQSEPTTPDSNGFITAVNSEIKPGSALNNSSSHVMSSQMEVVAPIVAAIAIVPER
jgi:ankyrin repeat protein